MRYLIAPDKFKGSLTAREVAETIANTIEQWDPTAAVDLCPIADGGEGTAALLAKQINATQQTYSTFDPLGRLISAELFTTESEAFLDMSSASGLSKVSTQERNPLISNTYGTGILIRRLIDSGIRNIHIGLGGSATVDAGFGMAAALGYRFLDRDKNLVTPIPKYFSKINSVEPPKVNSFPKMTGLTDVQTLLLGPAGCMTTFGKQKGLAEQEIIALNTELERLTHIIQYHPNASQTPGSGAAGGLGYGILSFLHGQLVSGFDWIAGKLDLASRINTADIVITGEGKIDSQSIQGKAPFGVAKLARQQGKAIWGIAGIIEDRELLTPYFDHIISLVDHRTSPRDTMQNAQPFLQQRMFQLLKTLR
jgi:glycerate 2-kinase